MLAARAQRSRAAALLAALLVAPQSAPEEAPLAFDRVEWSNGPEKDYARRCEWISSGPGGAMDLFVLRSSGRAEILRPAVDGTLALLSAVETGLMPRAGAWSDLDGDGRLDVAVAAKSGILIFRRADDGGLEPWGGKELSELDLDAWAVAWSDIDADGDADLLVGTHAGKPVLIENLGKGRFRASKKKTDLIERVATVRGIQWMDADGDGDDDVLLVGEQGVGDGDRSLRLVESLGKARFKAMPEKALGGLGKISWPIVGAHLGGRQDGSPSHLLLRFNGAADRLFVRDAAGVWQAADGFPAACSIDAAWTDLDGDGLVDLLLLSDMGRLRDAPGCPAGLDDAKLVVLLQRADGSFDPLPPGSFGELPQKLHALAAADYDADGDVDIAVLSGELRQPDLLYRSLRASPVR